MKGILLLFLFFIILIILLQGNKCAMGDPNNSNFDTQSFLQENPQFQSEYEKKKKNRESAKRSKYSRGQDREMAMNLDMKPSMGAIMGAGTMEGLWDGMMGALMGVEPIRILFDQNIPYLQKSINGNNKNEYLFLTCLF